MAAATGKIPKPQIRGLLQTQIKKGLIGATISTIVAGGLFKVFVADARKARYAEFYKHYDIEKTFNEMREKGLFDSCK